MFKRALKWGFTPNPLLATLAYAGAMGYAVGIGDPLKFLVAGVLFLGTLYFLLTDK